MTLQTDTTQHEPGPGGLGMVTQGQLRIAQPVGVSPRVRHISDLDGMSIKDAARMPHPADLARWSAEGLFWIDTDAGLFRTVRGRL